jgi:hypothetical protein
MNPRVVFIVWLKEVISFTATSPGLIANIFLSAFVAVVLSAEVRASADLRIIKIRRQSGVDKGKHGRCIPNQLSKRPILDAGHTTGSNLGHGATNNTLEAPHDTKFKF